MARVARPPTKKPAAPRTAKRAPRAAAPKKRPAAKGRAASFDEVAREAELRAVPVAVVSLCLGITERQVQNQVKAGVLPKSAHGVYDLPACVQAWVAYCELGKDSQDVAEAKRRYWVAKADGEELRTVHEAGRLVEFDQAQARFEQFLALLAATMDSWPGRRATEFAGIADSATIREHMLADVRELRALALAEIKKLSELQAETTPPPDATEPPEVDR